MASPTGALGEPDAARILLERALEIRERVLGARHPLAVATRSRLGSLLHGLWSLEEARSQLARVLDLRAESRGPMSLEVTPILNLLAMEDQKLERWGEAREGFERALAILMKARGEEHPDLARALYNFGQLALDRGDVGQGRRQFEDALRMMIESAAEPVDYEKALLLNALGAIERRQGDPAAARQRFEHEVRSAALEPRRRRTDRGARPLSEATPGQQPRLFDYRRRGDDIVIARAPEKRE